MSPIKTKEQVSFTININILKEFRAKANIKKMNMSKWIEEKMEEFLK